MKNSNNTSIAGNNHAIHEKAQNANNFAKHGRQFRDIRNSLVEEYNSWESYMNDSPVLLFTLAFFFLGIVEIIISWQMYGDLQSSIFDRPNPFLSGFLGMVIVTLGAVVSHYIGKSISSSLFNLEVYKLRHNSKYSISVSEAIDKVKSKTRKHLVIGIVIFIVLLLLVLGISFQRVALMGAISGENFGFFQKILPSIIVTLEVVSGIYLSYFFMRMLMKRKIRKQNKGFVTNKNACAYETTLCHGMYEHAMDRNEKVTYNKELNDTIYRFTKRSQDSDSYVDEIPEIRNLKVCVTNEGQVASGVHVFGILDEKKFTNAIRTNEMGQAILEWKWDNEYLVSVMVGGAPYPGPFHAYTDVILEIDHPKMLANA